MTTYFDMGKVKPVILDTIITRDKCLLQELIDMDISHGIHDRLGVNIIESSALSPDRMMLLNGSALRMNSANQRRRVGFETATEIQALHTKPGWLFSSNDFSDAMRYCCLAVGVGLPAAPYRAWSWVHGFWRRLWNDMIYWWKWSWKEADRMLAP